jgi:RHS repeat-associated protein
MTYPSGRVVNFNYAFGGGCCNSRLDSVVDNTTGATVISSITGVTHYDAAGDVVNEKLGNGVVQTYSYDSNRLQQKGITASLGGITLMNFSYNYGTSSTNTGRVLSRTDGIQPEHSASYSYDSIYRLSAVNSGDSTSSWGIAWSFDVWGNRLTQTPQGSVALNTIGTQTLTYTNNQLTCPTNHPNCYDLAGNQLSDLAPTPTNYTFNAENQIITSNGPGGTATYSYDGDGRRMKKVLTTTGTETTYTFYGPAGIISEFTTSSAIAGVAAAASTDRCFYHTTDKLGSAVLVMNSGGTVLENNRTLPYGEAWLPSDNGATSTNDKKFTTYQRDAESGLDYAMERYNAFAYGRFLSPDKGATDLYLPIVLNRYIYGIDDPINYLDPTGLSVVTLPPVTTGTPNCSTAFINYATVRGETLQQFFNTDQAVLGMMNYFEQNGGGSSADQAVWAALDWTLLHQYSQSDADKLKFYGSQANIPASFQATITSQSQVFSNGQLKAGFASQLLSILTGPLNSDGCRGLGAAFDVAGGVISAYNASVGFGTLIPTRSPIQFLVPFSLVRMDTYRLSVQPTLRAL